MAHGGDLIAEVLAKHGATHLFTLCGGHISPILTGAQAKGIRVVDVRDEANAVFAADAVPSSTRRLVPVNQRNRRNPAAQRWVASTNRIISVSGTWA